MAAQTDEAMKRERKECEKADDQRYRNRKAKYNNLKNGRWVKDSRDRGSE
ncbi:hypothetical protein H072_3429 [Dactylellina haptotyla CBS 200.50]|uniref:Uncharacterized protein n=1 Tax=Dactylellina haptotyla (strain CBS 200.50) TaxID=1284197 RepID=S8AN47_DACHA|nr:hypothetical protein H072_3429 [Dactylellina haptotyla CBS 200.50]